MDYKRFCYYFFTFNHKKWHEHWNQRELNLSGLEELFTTEIFTRRILKIEFPHNLKSALRVFAEIRKQEEKLSIACISETEPSYPKALLEYLAPEYRPPFIFLRGNNQFDESNCVAMVGTRNPSTFGIENAKNFAAFFSALNIKIVSGLARGIDTICHEENIYKGSIAILGGEIAEIYPAENQKLAEKILCQNGSVLSPFPIYQVPLPYNFPIRNRLIAAMAAGTVVVEGSEKSGASITGNLSLEMGKTTVALSQDFRSEFGRGAINLQQNGAILVKNEEEALHGIFSRFGGCSLKVPKQRHSSFNFQEFQKLQNCSIPQALAQLEEAVLRGNVKRIGFDQYRFVVNKNNA